jgi:hypothetical protein
VAEEENEGLVAPPEEEEHDDANRAVASTMILSWGYDREAERLEVSFDNCAAVRPPKRKFTPHGNTSIYRFRSRAYAQDLGEWH